MGGLMIKPSMTKTSGDARAVTGDGSSRAACLVPLLLTTESPVGRVQYTPRWVYGRLMASSSAPILIALIDDYDIVLTGIARMLDPYRNPSWSPKSTRTSR